MNKDELIAKQQLYIENQKITIANMSGKIEDLSGLLFSIGAPLNDNILQFNHKQKVFLQEIAELFEL